MFITLEGIEGSGKSTQVGRLAKHLADQGQTVLTTREPGGCSIADAVRALLLDPGHGSMVPCCELLLYAAARAQHVAEVIRPALARGDIVLCDRFADATLAYQGAGRGLDSDLIAELNRVATGGLTPDLTLLLDLQTKTGLQRLSGRDTATDGHDRDRIEQESLAFHDRVRKEYLALASENPDRFRIIDGAAESGQVTARIIALTDRFLKKRIRP